MISAGPRPRSGFRNDIPAVPEGDTIHRAAKTLARALSGQRVLRIDSVYPALTRLEESETPIRGRTIADVFSRGKHLIIRFSGDLCLRTHMRMSGSWHIYRRGEKWRRSRSSARIVLETDEWTAIGFSVPDAALVACEQIESSTVRSSVDLLSEEFDEDAALAQMAALPGREIGEVLLDQRIAGGVGNVFKSEIMFLAGVDPFLPVQLISTGKRRELLRIARRLLLANVSPAASGIRTTRTALDPRASLWVYKRKDKPCRRCGTAVRMARQGSSSRSTYWCPECQMRPD